MRNERGSSDRTDAGATPRVVTRGRSAAADTAEPGRGKERKQEDPVIFRQVGAAFFPPAAESRLGLKDLGLSESPLRQAV